MDILGIGGWELVVIIVVALLLVGPDRLPKMIAEGVKWVRVLRDQAANARRELAAVADLDPAITDELRRSVNDIAELHPKRIVSSFIDDATSSSPGAGRPGTTPTRPPASDPPSAPRDLAPPPPSFDADAT